MHLKYKGFKADVEFNGSVYIGRAFLNGKTTIITGVDKSDVQRCFRHSVNSYLANNISKFKEKINDGARKIEKS